MIDAGATVLIAFRIGLALFLLPSAIGKLMNWPRFVQGVLDFKILPSTAAKLFALALPWAELALAFGLIVGTALPITGLATAMLLGSFLCAVVINLRRGREISCNCFGIAGTATLGWGAVARNAILIALALGVTALSFGRGFPQPYEGVNALIWPASLDRLIPIILIALLVATIAVLVQISEWGLDLHVQTTQMARSAAMQLRDSGRGAAEALRSGLATRNGNNVGERVGTWAPTRGADGTGYGS
jgi:hypothetical protein